MVEPAISGSTDQWSLAVFAVTATAISVAGCASESPVAGTRDGSTNAADAAEPRRVTLTLWPFWEIPLDANGFGMPQPLGGVEVCVAYARPYDGLWTDFVPVSRLCKTSSENENVVLEQVPGMSELIVTASKEGYGPRAYAVTTGAWDEDVTGGIRTPDRFFFSLSPANSLAPLLQPGVEVAADRGALIVYSYVAFFLGEAGAGVAGFLGDVVVNVDRLAGDGPSYFLGGKAIVGATSTVPGEIPPPPPPTPTSMSAVSGAVFVNLPEDEYRVKLDQPNAFCSVAGRASDAVYGYAGGVVTDSGLEDGVIRAPILAGYVTYVVAECACLASDDVKRCAPAADAGAP